jgi:hypothetical protein
LKYLELVPVRIKERGLRYPQILRKPFDLSNGVLQSFTIPLDLGHLLFDVAYLEVNCDRLDSVMSSSVAAVKFKKQVPGFQDSKTRMLSPSID